MHPLIRTCTVYINRVSPYTRREKSVKKAVQVLVYFYPLYHNLVLYTWELLRIWLLYTLEVPHAIGLHTDY